MPFIQADLSQDYEDKPVAEGKYPLRIRSADERTSKNGAPQVRCIVDIEGEDNSAPIFHYLTFPKKDDDQDVVRTKMRFITRFLQLFDVPFEKKGFQTEDLPGLTAEEANIAQEVGDDNVPRNVIKL